MAKGSLVIPKREKDLVETELLSVKISQRAKAIYLDYVEFLGTDHTLAYLLEQIAYMGLATNDDFKTWREVKHGTATVRPHRAPRASKKVDPDVDPVAAFAASMPQRR